MSPLGHPPKLMLDKTRGQKGNIDRGNGLPTIECVSRFTARVLINIYTISKIYILMVVISYNKLYYIINPENTGKLDNQKHLKVWLLFQTTNQYTYICLQLCVCVCIFPVNRHSSCAVCKSLAALWVSTQKVLTITSLWREHGYNY